MSARVRQLGSARGAFAEGGRPATAADGCARGRALEVSGVIERIGHGDNSLVLRRPALLGGRPPIDQSPSLTPTRVDVELPAAVIASFAVMVEPPGSSMRSFYTTTVEPHPSVPARPPFNDGRASSGKSETPRRDPPRGGCGVGRAPRRDPRRDLRDGARAPRSPAPTTETNPPRRMSRPSSIFARSCSGCW